MEFCMQCGNALSSEAKFCSKCGAPVKKEPYAASDSEKDIMPPYPVPDMGTPSDLRPVLTCKGVSWRLKYGWLTLAVFFSLLALLTWWANDYASNIRKYRLSAHPYSGENMNWFMLAIGIFYLVCALINVFFFAYAGKYHIEVFEGHVEGLGCCLIGGIREINVPYAQVQGVTVMEKRCAIILQLASRRETMYCPDVETTKQMGQYINGRIRALYR